MQRPFISNSETIEVPRFALGPLVGMRACFLRDMSQRSNTRMNVSWENATITVFGSETARAAGVSLVENAIKKVLAGPMKKASRVVVLGDGYRKYGVTGVQFKRYEGQVDCFNAGRTVYRLDVSSRDDSEPRENDSSFDLSKITESLRIAHPTAEKICAQFTDATSSETMSPAAVEESRNKTIRNTEMGEIVEFLTDQIVKYTNGEAGDDKDLEDPPNRMTIRMSFGYKLFHSRVGESFDEFRPLSFDQLPKLNIGFGGDISCFFLPQIPLDMAKKIRNHALKLGYEPYVVGDPERLFRLNVIEVMSRTNISSTLRVIKDSNGQDSLEILGYTKKKDTIATGDIPSSAEGIDQRIKFQVESHAEPPQWFKKMIKETRISSCGSKLEPPRSIDTSLVVSTIRYKERKLYCSKLDKNSDCKTGTPEGMPCTGRYDATADRNTGWKPSVYELALSKTSDKDSDYFELTLRLVPESIPLAIAKNMSRKDFSNLVDKFVKESNRLTQVLVL